MWIDLRLLRSEPRGFARRLQDLGCYVGLLCHWCRCKVRGVESGSTVFSDRDFDSKV